jgi:hypothetical protein
VPIIDARRLRNRHVLHNLPRPLLRELPTIDATSSGATNRSNARE